MLNHPYEKFLHAVDKPTRYTGREHGSCIKDWDSVTSRVCLAFPDIYDIGTSHLGYRILYAIINSRSDMLAERCFTPWVDLRRELITRELHLVSLETRHALHAFDIVGFSLQFELCYTNVLGMLELGGIPLRSVQRCNDDPLVLAGGPVATHAEPMAPFFDAMLIGDGEEALVEMALEWNRTKALGMSRSERLASLAQLAGVYVPSLYETMHDATGLRVVARPSKNDRSFPIRRRIIASLQEFPFPSRGPVGGPEAVFDRMSVEVARGCTEGCRFCQAGMIYRPVRERPPGQILQAVEESVANSGQDEVSLTSLSTADISYISPLIKSLVRRTASERISLGVASLRAYGLSEDLFDELRKVRATGLTFAPEAGTQRLRDVINKNITDQQILTTAERVFSRGWHRMKLYFIMGLPTETDEDLLGIVDVGRRVLAIGRRLSRKRPEVTIGVSVHVPKPHTPFQWCAMDSLSVIRRKQAFLRAHVRMVRGLELRLHGASASVLECILARGDRGLADTIQAAYNAGAMFDSWDEQFRPDLWNAALDAQQVARESFLGTLPVEARLPWDHIDVGLEPDFLPTEYRRALKGRLSPPCGKPLGMHVHHTNVADAEQDSRKLVCYACGVTCDLTEMREQRQQYLTQLGSLRAEETAQAKPESATISALKRNPEALRPVRNIGELARYRFRYAKLESAVFLGHGDLIRELPRALRRAGLRLNCTQGFHPRPELSFGPALSLGVASIDEYFDVQLIDPPPIAAVLDRLVVEQSSGLWFRGALKLTDDAPRLSKLIHNARYALLLSDRVVQEVGGPSGLLGSINSFLAAESVCVERNKSGVVSLVDARRFVTHLGTGTAELVSEVLPFISPSWATMLELVVKLGPSGSVKPSEVVRAAFPGAGSGLKAIRAALLDADGRPVFDWRPPADLSWQYAPQWAHASS